MCKMRDFSVGCSATMSRIFSEMSETILLVKQSTLAFFLLQKLFTVFDAQSLALSVAFYFWIWCHISPCLLMESLRGLAKVEQICSSVVFLLFR